MLMSLASPIILTLVALLALSNAATSPPIWGSPSPLIQSQLLMLSNFPTSATASCPLTAPFTAIPKIFFGVTRIEGKTPVFTTMDWRFSISTLTTTNLAILFQRSASNILEQVRIYAVAIDTSFSYIYADNTIDFAGDYTPVNTGSGVRSTNLQVDFLTATGQSMNTAHDIRTLIFWQGALMTTSDQFVFDASIAFINSSHYKIVLTVDEATVLQLYRYSLCIYDKTSAQLSPQTLLPSGYMSSINGANMPMKTNLPTIIASNFMIGFVSMSYAYTVKFDGFCNPGGVCPSSMTFSSFKVAYWQFLTRACPTAFPYYDQTTDLCYDACVTACIPVTFINTTKNPTANQLTFSFQVPADLTGANISSIFPTPPGLSNPIYVFNNGVLQLTYDYSALIQSISFTVNSTPAFSYSGFLTVPVSPANNLPAVFYSEDTYREQKQVDKVYKGMVYASYGFLFLGLLSNSITPIELFGLLQLAHITTSNLEGVEPHLAPIMNLSIVHGPNVDLGSIGSSVPSRVASIGYKSDMIGNFNLMLGLVLLEVLVACVVLLVGKFVPRLGDKMQEVATTMLKKYLLVLVLFNLLNISYSAGLQFGYGSPKDPLFGVSVIAVLVSLALPIAAVGAILFTGDACYGEWKEALQKDIPSRLYFVAVIAYRGLLGLSTSKMNEIEEATILNVFACILFLVYAASNTPFKKPYHNYRTVIVHLAELVVLSVTMYYRSMKSTTPVAERSFIVSPAVLELVAILFAFAVSAACCGYECYLKAKELVEMFKKRNKVPKLEAPKVENTVFDLVNGHITVEELA